MKKIWATLLILCLAFVSCSAMAEDTPYVPGEISHRLIDQAVREGKILGATFQGVFTPGEGLADDEEEAAIYAAIGQALEQGVFFVGGGKTVDGPRLELAAQYLDPAEANDVSISLGVTFGHDVLYLDSDLLGDRRLSVRYETLLRMMDLPDEAIDVILSLKDADLSALMQELSAQASELLEQAGTMLAPYAEVVMQWASSLPVTTVDHIQGSDFLTVMPGMTQVVLTEADAARLCVALIDQLSKDETLLPLLQAALASQPLVDADIDLPSALTELRDALAQVDSEDESIILTFGANGDSPIVVSIDALSYANDSAWNLTLMVTSEDEQVDCFLRVSGVDAESDFRLTSDLSVAQDASDPQAVSFFWSMDCLVDGETVMDGYYGFDVVPYEEEGEQGISFSLSGFFSLPIEGVACVVSGDTLTSANAAKESESTWAHVEESVYTEGEVFLNEIIDERFVIAPSEDGFLASFDYQIALPELSIDAVGVTGMLAPYAYDYSENLAALETLALEETDGETLNALLSDALTGLTSRRDALIPLLPTELQAIAEALMNDTEEALEEGTFDLYEEVAEPVPGDAAA